MPTSILKLTYTTEFDNTPSLLLENFTFNDSDPWDILYQDIRGRMFIQGEGYLKKYLYENFTNHHGYYGRTFELHLRDGSIEKVVGPWSSRVACVNAHLPQDKHLIHTDSEVALSLGALRLCKIPPQLKALIRIPPSSEVDANTWANQTSMISLEKYSHLNYKPILGIPDMGPDYIPFGKVKALGTQNRYWIPDLHEILDKDHFLQPFIIPI